MHVRLKCLKSASIWHTPENMNMTRTDHLSSEYRIPRDRLNIYHWDNHTLILTFLNLWSSISLSFLIISDRPSKVFPISDQLYSRLLHHQSLTPDRSYDNGKDAANYGIKTSTRNDMNNESKTFIRQSIWIWNTNDKNVKWEHHGISKTVRLGLFA